MKILRESRINKKMYQTTLAKKMNVSLSTIKRWEKGVTFPNFIQLDKLKKELGFNMMLLMKEYIDDRRDAN